MFYCFWNIKVVLGNSGLVNTLEEQVEVRRERSLGTFSAHVQVAGISGWTVECFIALNAAWGLAMSGLFLQILSWDFLPLKHVSRDLCEQSFFFFFFYFVDASLTLQRLTFPVPALPRGSSWALIVLDHSLSLEYGQPARKRPLWIAWCLNGSQRAKWRRFVHQAEVPLGGRFFRVGTCLYSQHSACRGR